jgi:ACS family hexuronate transporter-like MFS transporter
MISAGPLISARPRGASLGAWVLCGLLFVATALSFLDRQVLSVLAPVLTDDLGMSNTDYSRVVSTFVLAYTIMFAAGGWLVDRLGTVRGLAISVAVWSLGSAGHALAAGALGLGAARFILGLGEGACFPAATKGAVEWFPAHQRGLAIGIAIGGSAFGSMLAPPLTAVIAGRFGWRGAFVTTGLIGLVWLVTWIIAGRFAPAASDSANSEASQTGSSGSHDAPDGPEQGNLLRRPAVWHFLLARFFFDPVFYFYLFWIPQFLAKERAFSLDDIGDYYWIPFLALGLSNIASGQLGDFLIRRGWSPRRTRRTLLSVAALVTPVSGLVVCTPNAAWALALMALLMAAHGLWISNFVAHISDFFPSRVMATVFGMTGAVGGTAGIIATMVTGPVVDRHGFTPIFVCMAFLYPVALLVLLAMPPAAAHPARTSER